MADTWPRPWRCIGISRVTAAPILSMGAPMRSLKIAIPNKGRLADDATALLRRAGIHLRGSSERRLFATALGGRIQILFLRAQDIPAMVADGTVDGGITGLDVIREAGVEVDDRLDLGFGKCRLVVAVPNEHAAQSAGDLPDGCRLATSFPHLARTHFEAIGKHVKITEVSGACEITPTLGVAEAIVDLTSSGSTLVMNHLREIGTVIESTCRFITADVDPAIADEMDRVIFALESVVAAEGKRYLMADVPRDALQQVHAFLPGVAGPTVTDIAGDPDTVAIQVVVDDNEIFDAVHKLKALGGRGILVLPIERLVP